MSAQLPIRLAVRGRLLAATGVGAAVAAFALSALAAGATATPTRVARAARPSPGARVATMRASGADAALLRAIDVLGKRSDGPPAIAVVVQRGRRTVFAVHGRRAARSGGRISISDHMRLASVAKAFSGAVALSLVAEGRMSLGDTIGKWLPSLPAAWSQVTLGELLQHTSGIPDFSKTDAFGQALSASLLSAPPPESLLSFVAGDAPDFTPGSKYQYSNTDNIIVALMAAAAGHSTYEGELSERVLVPLGLRSTSLPRGAAMPQPLLRGYAVDPPKPPEDISEVFAAGWSWASGGIVSTPRDANAFVREYVRGATTNGATRASQFTFVPGSSEPPGPGTNSAGLAIFRYQTRCGTVYGHTGNTAGYTQFISANAAGTRSAVVSVNAQITPSSNAPRFAELRRIYTLAVCAALAR